MRDTYIRYTFPVKYSRKDVEVTFEEMFTDVRLQMFENSKQLPEEMTYRDVDKLLKAKRSSKRIECTQLLEVLDDRVAPHSVLIIGIPGVGKTTFVKQMAKQWANEKMWEHVRYLFVIALRELQQDRMMTLEELLFDQLAGLSLTEDERRVAMDEIVASQEHTVVFLEGADELRSFKYTKQYERGSRNKADMNTLISSLVSGAVLPGAKVVITTRPIDQLSSKVCSRVTEIFGFSEENIKKYVHKFSGGDFELAQIILSYLATNANIATFCYIPVTCNFVCMCLQDMQSGDMASVRTMTQMYAYAIMHLVRKLHPLLRDDPRQLDSKAIFSEVGPSLTSHAKVAKRCTMRSPLQLILYNEDVEEISTDDRQSGFLDQSLTLDEVTRERSQQCWSFTHLTIQEFFTAVGLLMGPVDDISQLTESEESIRKQELVLTFVVGLLCDQRNAKFMEYFLSGSQQMTPSYEPQTFLEYKKLFRSKGHQMTPRTFLENLAAKTYHLQLVSLVHETQREDLVDVVPADIRAKHVFPTEMTSLVWATQQQNCPIVKLE